MAIDHASYFIARVHPLETWATPPPYYADTAEFLTRWLTHLCAPGFFMLMGIGIVYLAESRVAAGWSAGRITRFLATRGAVLLVVQHLIENPAWLLGTISANPLVEASLPSLPGAGGEIMLSFGVLSALGVAMIVGSVLWRAPWWVSAGIVMLAVMVSSWLTPMPVAIFDPQPVWMQLFFVPGRTGILQNLYPWVVWLVPMVFGLSLGRAFRRDPDFITREVVKFGVFLVVLFVALRWVGGGDAHPPTGGLIGFLTVTKYPPSGAFFAITLGLNLLLLAALAKWPARWLAPLEVFGRAPFFFYLAHLWLLAALSWLFPMGTSFPVMYLVWAVVVLALYPMCTWYARLKSSRPPASLWRML